MIGQAHPLVQDAHDADAVSADAVDVDVRTDQVGQVSRGQIAPPVAELRVLADRLERVVDLVAVGQQLRLTLGFAGLAQDVDEILSCFRGELER